MPALPIKRLTEDLLHTIVEQARHSPRQRHNYDFHKQKREDGKSPFANCDF